MDPQRLAELQSVALGCVLTNETLRALDGAELATVLNAAAGTVTHALHGQVLRASIANALAEAFKPGDA